MGIDHRAQDERFLRFGIAEFQEDVRGRVLPQGAGRLPVAAAADETQDVAFQAAVAAFVGCEVQPHRAHVADQADLQGIENGGFPAAVVAHQKQMPLHLKRVVGEAVPVDEPDPFQSFHEWSSPLAEPASAGFK